MAKSKADCERECRADVLEVLAELYLRLNGYFCIRNYLDHRAKSNGNGLNAEFDLLAIRLPRQAEILSDGKVQQNDPNLVKDDMIDCLIVEVKEAEVEFNKPIRGQDGWNRIAAVVQMFGVLESEAKDLAKNLHQQIRNSDWEKIPVAIPNNHEIRVRMVVFSYPSAKKAGKRAFISLEHILDFVQDRMKPGEVCSSYSRGPHFSPWRGINAQIVQFLDDCNQQTQSPKIETLLAHICNNAAKN